jgi:hypothetical protein
MEENKFVRTLATGLFLALAISIFAFVPRGQAASTGPVHVTNGEDDGAGSLRAAIRDSAPQSTIDFAFSGAVLLTSGELAIAHVLARAIGSSLTNAGVPNALQDPMLELHDGSGSLLASNDNWCSDQEQEITATTVPPIDDRESAIVATLNPGAYTAIVRGKENTTGVALIEVYALQ